MSADHATPLRSPAWPADEPWHLLMPEGTLYDALARATHPGALGGRVALDVAVIVGATLIALTLGALTLRRRTA